MSISKEHLDTEHKYNCETQIPCFGCGKLTEQRVKTKGLPTIAELLGEEESEFGPPSTFWAPICEECLDK